MKIMITAVAMLAASYSASATELKNVRIASYDCSLSTVAANSGKCDVTVMSEGKALTLKASSEVAAPWGNAYGAESCHPVQGLNMVVTEKNEILTITDPSGNRISTKFDYSR